MALSDSGPLSESAGEVFAQLAALARATRPRLAAACALSKPTVSAAIAELEAAGLVERDGTAHGSTGRSAAVYRLARAAGYVLAVDRGSTQVSFRTIALDGELLDEDQTPRLDQACSMIGAALRRRRQDGPLRAAVVAVNDVVLPEITADAETAERVAGAVASLRLPRSVPVAVENNVNCAAIAELHDGGDGDRDTFVYLQVGVGIGAGIVVGRRLLRGRNGAAGEIARLAYPWAERREPGREALEARLGSPGLMRQVGSVWSAADGPLPQDPEAVFALAAEGHARAAALVAEHAAEVGKVAASLTAVLDPGLVILGGGVGRNPLLTDGVRRTLEDLSWPTKVEVSRLGERATVLGAAHLAREHGVNSVVTGAKWRSS